MSAWARLKVAGAEKVETTITLNLDELDILLHFATLGQNYVIGRNNYGDREVARELDPVLTKVTTQLLDSVQ